MFNTFKFLGMVWSMVVFSYIMIALLSPLFVSVTAQTIADQIATGTNLANYPGSQAAVSGFPFYVWFIPGGVGTAVTVGYLKMTKPNA